MIEIIVGVNLANDGVQCTHSQLHRLACSLPDYRYHMWKLVSNYRYHFFGHID